MIVTFLKTSYLEGLLVYFKFIFFYFIKVYGIYLILDYDI